ncbi:TPA: LytTR family transcriptional regulator DNA-binding domain-containing protein [Streptococcus agalactiae]|nr:LytTR family transcriptional regulator DNA-binding domain-containing protein [Streptococcus agalactiae]
MDYIIAKKETLTVKIQFSEILYIGTIPGRPSVLRFITDNGVYEAYGKIKDFEVSLGLIFKRCHRKYLVNLKRVKAIDTETRQIIFDNSEVASIECSRRSLTDVLKEWKNL